MSAVLKWCSLGFAILGVLFLAGGYLALAQGVILQIGALGVTGVVCLTLALILLIIKLVKFPKEKAAF